MISIYSFTKKNDLFITSDLILYSSFIFKKNTCTYYYRNNLLNTILKKLIWFYLQEKWFLFTFLEKE